MIRYAVLTYDFRVPCATYEGLFCGRLGSLETLDAVKCLGQLGDNWNFISSPPRTLWFDFLSNRPNRAVAAGQIKIETVDDSGIVRLKERSGYIHLTADGKLTTASVDPDTLGDRALFRLVEWDKFVELWNVIRQSWSLGPHGERVAVEEWKSTFRTIQFGPLQVPFDVFCTALSKRPSPREITFIAERNVHRAVLYRPAILYVVFGEKVLEEFRTSLESIRDPGFYTGEILVATDLLEGQIEIAIPDYMRAQCRILPMSAFDFPDYISTRQTLFSSGELDDYGPLLYMDGDVVANTPLEPVFLRAALEHLTSAQLEHFNGDFRYSQSNGEVLFSQDPYNYGQSEAGFNTGVFLVPHVSALRPLLDAAFMTNLIYTDKNGRGSIPFHEQSVMNYALRKVGAFDATFINDITDVGGDRSSSIVQEYGSMDPTRARGFVHFWCYGGSRSLAMSNYTRQIRNYRRRKGL